MASIELDVEYTEDEMWEDFCSWCAENDPAAPPHSRELFVEYSLRREDCLLRVGADGTRYWTMPRAVAAEAFCDLQETGTPRRVWRN